MRSTLSLLSERLKTKRLAMQRRQVLRSYLWSLRLEKLESRMVMAGEFTDLGNIGILNGLRSSASWGDFDNDGDLDVLLTGFAGGDDFARVFRNNNGTFVDHQANLLKAGNGAAAWGDYDEDGDLDIVLTGRDRSTNTSISKIYRNDNGSFIDIAAPLTGVRYSSVDWGDYDNDGDLDILIAGRVSGSTNATRLYRNDGNDSFTNIPTPLNDVAFGTVEWGDYDNDGDLDILLSGTGAGGRQTHIFRNDAGSFTNISAGLTLLNNSSADWGDYDNDGDLDFVISGQQGSGQPISFIYRNNGAAGFSDIGAGLPSLFYSAASWGDYDNDGDLDLALTGRTGVPTQQLSRIFRNDGASGFVDINAGLTGFDLNSAVWGDYDNDGDLDLLLSGRDAAGVESTRVFRNNSLTPNTAPSAPSGLQSTVLSADSMQLSWTAPNDAQTPSAGLSYNLRVGTSPGASNVFSSMANGSTGARRIPDAGLIQRTSHVLRGLTPGATYYWSVQAIDTAFAGSTFASEASFTPKASPAINVTPVQTTSPFGYAISGQAAISGGFNPTGTVTFRLYDNVAGTGTPIFTDTQPLVAGTATSANYTALVPGNLNWIATYNGNNENNVAVSGVSAPVVVATPIFVGGAYWYLGPGTVGSELQVNRYVPGESPVWVDGGLGLQIGQALDGSVLVRNAAKAVYSRSGSLTGIGSGWNLRTSVTAGDGATWFLGPDNVIGDPFIYRWADGESPAYTNGRGVGLFVGGDGSVFTKTGSNDFFQNIGSNAGFSTNWQLLARSISVNPTSLNLGIITVGLASAAQSFTVSGSYLSSNLIVTAPSGIELSIDNGNSWQASQTLAPSAVDGSVAVTSIRARIGSSTPLGNLSGNITVSSTGATQQNVGVSGSIIEASSLIVTTANDAIDGFDGLTSLREAIAFANNRPGADTILFDASLAGQTLTLGTLGQFEITQSGAANRTTIVAPTGGITISGNQATRVFHVHGGVAATINGLTIINGYANEGGAILNAGGDLSVLNAEFRNNVAHNSVGGAISSYSSLSIENSLFYLNKAVLGGAINSSNGLSITDTTFSTNEASFNGGALRIFGTTTITGSTFSNNQAINGGGGLINHGALTITNSTFGFNTALDGGGLQAFEGTTDLLHVTIASNTATRFGGGIAASPGVTATNTIIAGNAGNEGSDLFGTLEIASSNNRLNQSAAAAGLGTFANHGGRTATFSLLPGSPAIDAGNTSAATGLTTDQRGAGFNRLAAAAVDIGAFEVQNQPPTFTSLSNAVLPENTQTVLSLAASDPDVPAQTITFVIAGSGADNHRFQIIGGNQLRFIAPPDFENPQDLGGATVGDNIYVVTVQADDGNGGTALQMISVTITNVDDVTPILTSFRRQASTPTLTNADTLQFRAEFSEQVQGVDSTDFVVSGGSTASVTAVAPVQGTGESVYLLTVSGGNLAVFNGSVGINLAVSQNITDTAGNVLATAEPSVDETYTLDNIAPRVSGVVIDDGSRQRSRVRSITINFDSEIIFNAGAFDLRTPGGAVIAVQTNIAPGVATNRVVLSFPGTIGGSLADGNYRLRILDTHIRDVAGNALDGDGNGSAGGVRVDEFFRLFGDMDGDRDVDAIDTRGLRATYRKAEGQSGFDNLFDFDGDGDVDAIDQRDLNLRYRTRLPLSIRVRTNTST